MATKEKIIMEIFANLPNGNLSRIFDHRMRHRDAWEDAWVAAYFDVDRVGFPSAKENYLYNVVRSAAFDQARESLSEDRCKIWSSITSVTNSVLFEVILALLADDNCGYLLDEEPEHVRTLALLGNYSAAMLLPACLALHSTKELV